MTRDHVEEARQRALGELIAQLEGSVEAEVDWIESPIEKAFAYEVIGRGASSYLSWCDGEGFVMGAEGPGHPGDPEGTQLTPHRFGFGPWEVWSQVAIGPYRCDFVIARRHWSGRRFCLVVELDGHEFHERTKEQVRRDKRRDRYMAQAGLAVFRFAGSEVYADVGACVKQCLSHLAAVERRETAPLDEAPGKG